MEQLLHENEYMISLLIDGVIHATYKDHLRIIDLEITKQCVQERIAATKGVTRPLLIDMAKVVEVDQPSRQYLSEDEGNMFLSATAIIVKNQISRFLATIYVKINTPKIPTRFFTDKDEALRWLEAYKHLN